MMGWWYNALGAPMLHIADILLDVGVEVKTMLPAKIEMGARICLGARKYCQSKESAAGEVGGTNYISGALFGGFSYQDPTENYLLVMSTEFGIGKIFRVFGDTVDATFHEWERNMAAE